MRGEGGASPPLSRNCDVRQTGIVPLPVKVGRRRRRALNQRNVSEVTPRIEHLKR